MLKIENTEVLGWEHAIRGMRNPMNSWEKSDSNLYHTSVYFDECNEQWETDGHRFMIGPNDLDLMTRLRNAGTDHRKFMRMIVVYADLTGPLYWWKEFDTYKVGTVANSCSTMHKIAAKEFSRDDFSWEHLSGDNCVPDHDYQSSTYILDLVIESLNFWRHEYLTGEETGLKKDKRAWWQMIQLLPASYNQRRTVMLNYEVLANIYKSRRNHKLDEWHTFCDWIEDLPYSKLIMGPSLKDIPKDLAYVEGKLFDDYIHDMKLTQQFAVLNRKAMVDVILNGMGLTAVDIFTTIHNYIDTDAMILRKGSVSAKKGEKLLIPINMRDGSLICIGTGNEDWNCSAPHGAGRLMSRRAALNTLSMEEFQDEMKGIYTTCVVPDTLDESPMAYKSIEEIVSQIGPTAIIVERIRPVYNFKASD